MDANSMPNVSYRGEAFTGFYEKQKTDSGHVHAGIGRCIKYAAKARHAGRLQLRGQRAERKKSRTHITAEP